MKIATRLLEKNPTYKLSGSFCLLNCEFFYLQFEQGSICMKKRQLFASGRCLPHIYNFNLIVVLQDVFKLTVNHSVCMGNFHIFTRETKLVLDHYIVVSRHTLCALSI